MLLLLFVKQWQTMSETISNIILNNNAKVNNQITKFTLY